MKKQLFNRLKYSLKKILIACTFIIGFTISIQAQGVKNIVIVHGAFADGSGFKAVYGILVKKGYHVTVVQNPLSSLEADVAATKVILDEQKGPVVLVGHSWGGSVITEAGTDPKVVALVYIAAFQPDKGESALQWAKSAPAAPESGILPPDKNGILYYDLAKYHAGFCADIPEDEANFMAASQGAFYLKAFASPMTKVAWRLKPSFGLIATDDKSINPIILRKMYLRSKTKVTETKGSHAIFISKPDVVARVIMEAAESYKPKK